VKKLDLISVIVPLYNKEKYIADCIKSILVQSYTEFEVIVINDGSTDNSAVVVEEIQRNNDKVILINQENRGRSLARNEGIYRARGKYVLMVDADDTIEQRCLELLHAEIVKNDSDACVCGMNVIGKRTRTVCSNQIEKIEIDRNFIYNYIAQSGGNFGTSSCNKLFKMDTIQKNKILYRDMEIGEDYIFCLEYAYYSKNWCAISQPLYNYIQVSESTMHTMGEGFDDKIYKINDGLNEFADCYNMSEYLQNAISASSVKLLFKELLSLSNISDRHKKKKKIKEYLCNPDKRNMISGAKIKDMGKKYKVFYILYRMKSYVLLSLLITLYKIYTGGTV